MSQFYLGYVVGRVVTFGTEKRCIFGPRENRMTKMVELSCFVKDMTSLDRQKNSGSNLIDLANEISLLRDAIFGSFYIWYGFRT